MAVIILAVAASGAGREGVHNGSFEDGLHSAGTRPVHWNVGFPGDVAPFPGTWSLRQSVTAEPSTVLEIGCESDEQTCLFSQIVDLPAATMSGVSISLSVRVQRRTDHGWVAAQLVALNPEVPVDPETGISHVGYIELTPTTSAWEELEGSITLRGPAQIIALVLFVVGDGAVAAFDDVSVTADMGFAQCGPLPNNVEPLVNGLPPFPIGITNENPRNTSDQGFVDLAARAAETVDIVNLFVHIRWNGLSGLPMLAGHDQIIDTARNLSRAGVARMVTLDFTHNSLEGLGDLNPLPDGMLPGRLDDPGVSEAYLDELVSLAAALEPEIVSVGIETNFFWSAHPDQWTAFRNLVCAAGTRLKAQHPGIHVTTYFTLSSLVDSEGESIQPGQEALRELLPCIDSVGYSDYWADGTHHVADIPPGYFLAASAVAPELPLILPEFGYRGDDLYPEAEQEAYLRRVFSELREHSVRAAVLYSLYDQSYLGAPIWFQEAFGGIGMIRLDGTPKRSYALLHRTRRQQGPPILVEPRLQCVPAPRRALGRRAPR